MKSFTTLRELQNRPEYGAAARYLMYAPCAPMDQILDAPWDIVVQMSGWNTESINYGHERLLEVLAEGEQVRPLYTECEDDPFKKDVNLIRFPAKQRKEGSPYIIVIAGGGFATICSLVEAYPVAARMNESGYDVFVLNYRVSVPGLMPKPVDDLAAAVRYIKNNEKELGVDGDNYIVCGFSAGAYLTALWGTKSNGYSHYDLPKPKALFPVYPMTTTTEYINFENQVIAGMFVLLFGQENMMEKAASYDVLKAVDETYPPCYICANKDDDTLDYHHSSLLYDKLNELKIPAELQLGEKGGHGFGEGRGLEVEGWISKALSFAEKL